MDKKSAYSVAVLGFNQTEKVVLGSIFGLSSRRAPQFVPVPAGQETAPDIYLVDADDAAAVEQLQASQADSTHPAILIGSQNHGLKWPLLARPLQWTRLFKAFDLAIDGGPTAPAVPVAPAVPATPATPAPPAAAASEVPAVPAARAALAPNPSLASQPAAADAYDHTQPLETNPAPSSSLAATRKLNTVAGIPAAPASHPAVTVEPAAPPAQVASQAPRQVPVLDFDLTAPALAAVRSTTGASSAVPVMHPVPPPAVSQLVPPGSPFAEQARGNAMRQAAQTASPAAGLAGSMMAPAARAAAPAGAGTHVHDRVPAFSGSLAPTPAQKPAELDWALVVDDNATVREFMRSKLAPFQINVDFAESGEEAIGMTANRQYTCVFLDVIMPGMDGYQVCKLIKARRGVKKTAVVMLTSKGSPFDRIRGTMAGCDSYLTKPVNEDKLLETIAKYLMV